MSNTSAAKLVPKSIHDLQPQNLAVLRRQARRKVDTSDIPETTLTGTGESHRVRKRSVTLRLDEDVVEFFQAQGTGYQTRINRVLRAAIHPSRSLRERLKETATLLDQLADQVR